MSTRTEDIRISAEIMASNMLDDATGISKEYRSDFMRLLVPCIESASFWDREADEIGGLDEAAYEELDSIFSLFIQSDEVAYLEKQIHEDELWATELEDEMNRDLEDTKNRFKDFDISELSVLSAGLERQISELMDLDKSSGSYYIHFDELNAAIGLSTEIDDQIKLI